MSLGARTALAIALTSFASIAVAGLAFRFALHRDLDPFAENFAMMRSMMRAGPDLVNLYAIADAALVLALLIALAFALLIGSAMGWSVTRAVRSIHRGLLRFGDGHFDDPIAEIGPGEMKLIAASVNRMAMRLSTAHKAERELVAGVVHDLAHPVTAIRATVDALSDGVLDLSDASVVRRLHAGISALELTLNDMRDVAAYEAGQIRLHVDEVDLCAIVFGTRDRYSDVARLRGVSLLASTEDACVIRSDAQRLRRLLDNLVVNAMTATQPSGKVTIRCRQSLTGLRTLEVEDEAGQDGAERLRMSLHHGARTGLGLRVVSVIAEALGAGIELEATASGSLVRVHLGTLPDAAVSAAVR